METVHNLRDSTIEKLNELIEINIDSAKGCREAAESIENSAIAHFFRNLAEERAQQGQELKGYVRYNKEEPEDSGSVAGTMHRMWLDFRAAISGGDPKAILVEAERGEDKIKEKYEDVLKETAGSPLNGVLQRQYMATKKGHDQVRDMRDRYLAD